MLRTVRFIAVVLAALALTMTSAHVLELPQKMQYGPDLYSAVNTTLYKYFAIAGGVYSMGAIAAIALVSILVSRRSSAFRWTLAALLFMSLWFLSWLAVVVPVNSTIATALELAPQTVPALWIEMRARWEYGHVAGFALQLTGFCALVVSVLVDTPFHKEVTRETTRSPDPQGAHLQSRP